MKKSLLAALLIISSGCATAPPSHGSKKPVHQGLPPQIIAALHQAYDPPLLPEVFDSFDAAAVYASASAYEFSNKYESSGVIVVRSDMKFQVTKPVTEFSGDSVGIPHFKRPGYIVIADYHTHPCNPYTHWCSWFSPEDIDVVEGANDDPTVIAIMVDFCTGTVHEWAQGKDPVGDHLVQNDDGSPDALTTGHKIGQITLSKKPVVQETPPDSKHDFFLTPVEE